MTEVNKTEQHDLVRMSRAGDVFHYRWAARFCLNIIKPDSLITSVTIEQSKDSEKPGECIMDMTAYSEKDSEKYVDYYQMKHSNVHADQHMTLGLLRNTIEGFSDRYKYHKSDCTNRVVKYFVVTNRRIDNKLLTALSQITNGDKADNRINEQLIRYTNLNGSDLKEFCSNLILKGGEGDYEDQFYGLVGDTGRLISGLDNTEIVNKLINMIWDRVLPNNKSEITKEIVLNQFGCSSEKYLYPAPSSFEKLETAVKRDEYIRLADAIIEDERPKIITAIGGIGKSIFTGMLPDLLGEECLTIIYDCFGNGTYRNRLKFRHRHQDAFVQITNELADLGYCEPLIPVAKDPDSISESFQERLSEAVSRHKKLYPNGRLILAIDAADNAEMAGKINEQCAFPSDLLQQGLPAGCIVVMLCRPERACMLKVPRDVVILRMAEFSVKETEQYLASNFSDIDTMIAEEVHRLTNGIPRVISIASQESNSIQDVLQRLGPTPTTAEDQVEYLLAQAKNRISDQLSEQYLEEINALCCGLAVLPPDIPLHDLSAIAKISEDTIMSFVSEMGAQIIIAERHLHFRDEPTEHWFQMTYSSNQALIKEFITRIEPLTEESIYLATALPELYVMVGNYDKMIDVVLTEQFLPKVIMEADVREVEYTRLRFAVRAAINADRYRDLMALGLMAGDKGEIHNRVYRLYQDHFDIVHQFLSKEPLRELAYKSKLKGSWIGSDKLYTAVLMSGTADGDPEARVYLRSARQFLGIYFEERKHEDRRYHQEQLTNDDVFAFVLTTYNIFGLEEAIKDIQVWSPAELRFKLSSRLAAYLIDMLDIDEVLLFLEKVTNDAYSALAIIFELDRIAIFPDKRLIKKIASEAQFEELDFSDNYMLKEEDAAPMMAVVTFCERLIVAEEKDQCLKLVDMLQQKFSPSDFKSDFYNYKRAIALRAFTMKKKLNPGIDFFNHEYFSDENKEQRAYQDRDTVKGIFNTLYPWYELRLRVILGEIDKITEKVLECKKTSEPTYDGQYGRFNAVEKERYVVAADIFLKHHWESETEALKYYEEIIETDRHGMPRDRVRLMRGLMRSSCFYVIIHRIEASIHEMVVNDFDEPYERVETLMQMVRSYLKYSPREARAYFEETVNENERFGDDLPSKWQAIASIARRATDGYNCESDLSYRFIRVAEFVGEHVGREKYWDRNGAMRIATLLSPIQGLAALSRWRERNVGCVEEQLEYVIEALIDQDEISAEQIWGLSGFFPDSEYFVVNLAVEAIKRTDDIVRLKIAKEINRIAGIKGYSRKICEELKEVLEQLHDFVDPVYPGREDNVLDTKSSGTYKQISDTEIEALLADWQYDGMDSLRMAFKNVNSVDGLSSNNDYYWQCLMEKVPLPTYSNFLLEILSFSNEFWNVTRILTNIPDIWKETRSFLKFWLELLKDVGSMFASEFLSSYYRKPLEERSEWSNQEWHQIYTGCVEAYKTNYTEFGTSDYYDLASIGSMIESPEESLKLLDMALATVEKDINVGFADGKFDNAMITNRTLDEAYGAFFKVALASPDSEVRWMAVHGLVRFGLAGDGKWLKNLVNTIISVDAGAFLGRGFLLYDMNCQLYLLIALHRIALEQPQQLVGMTHIFQPYFEEEFSHGLIQLTVFKIIKLLREYTGDLFSEEEIEIAEKRFISNGLVIHTKNYYEMERSDKYKPLVEKNDKFHAAFDFDRYWLNALEKMFNIPVSHLEALIGQYIAESMDVKIDENGWVHDARRNVFSSHKYEMRTQTSQGELPSAERLSFYLSYHGMYVIAGRLLKSETLYISDYEDESDNPYLGWLERHYLYREDGFMLFDGRTPTPVVMPKWANSHIDETWLSDMGKDYLGQNIFVNGDICVDGYWEYQKNGYREIVTIDTALIDSGMVFSLLITLEDLSPNDYYLGNRERHNKETNNLFHMESWIIQRNSYSELDKHDPWAKGTKYPDYEIEDSFVKKLNLQVSKLRNQWLEADNGSLSAYTENWVENLSQYNDEYFQPNTRIIATEELVKRLCGVTDKVLIINVKIDRIKIKDRYSSDDESDRHSFHEFKVIDADGWWNDEG